jgi:hypothetical protein
MSKLTNNREILYFQTAVLAEPSDHNSGRPEFLEYFSRQNPNPLRWFGEKSWTPGPGGPFANTNYYYYYYILLDFVSVNVN